MNRHILKLIALSFGLLMGANSALAQPVWQSTEGLHGVAFPKQQVELSVPSDGVVGRLMVSEGQIVDKDQLLLAMDDRIARESYKVAELSARHDAMIRHTEASVKLSEFKLRNLNEAYQSGAADGFEVEEARVQLEQAKAQHDAELEKFALAGQQLELERAKLAQLELRAPFAGRVIRVETKVGSSESSAEPVVVIASLDMLKVELHLPLDLFGNMKVGDTYLLSAHTPVNSVVSGRLTTIDPIIDSATETFRCVFEIENKEQKLPAGFAVELDPATLSSLQSNVVLPVSSVSTEATK